MYSSRGCETNLLGAIGRSSHRARPNFINLNFGMGTMALGESHIISCRSDSLDFSDEFLLVSCTRLP